MEIDEVVSGRDRNKTLKDSILQHISLNEEAHFKNQQRTDPDLTSDEKWQIAKDILDNNPGSFLSRFGKYLNEEHLDYFADLAPHNYEVNYYIDALKKKFQKHCSKSLIRNRRLEALRRLHSNGDYFSDDEMRKRNPMMYEHLVGQYLTEEEKQHMHADRIASKSFTGIILNAIDEKEVEDRLQNEKELDVSPYERDSDDSNDSFVQKNCSLWGEYTSSGNDTVNSVSNISCLRRKKINNKKNLEPVSEEEKAIMMNEFRSQMFAEFLGGNDMEFDYSKVDANTDYDDLDMLEIDEQDQYFDSESPEILSRGEESSDSSISFNSTVPRPKNLEEKMASLGN